MANYNDLINVTFEDAVTYGTTVTSDILGVIMPYHWGPAGKVNIFNKQEFYDAYPEYTSPLVTITDAAYKPYYLIKSFFNNGGSRVAVYRPIVKTDNVATELFFESDFDTTSPAAVELSTGTKLYLAFKYPGLPNLNGGSPVLFSWPSNDINNPLVVGVVNVHDDEAANFTIYESFKGQVTNPAGVDSVTGETTYLPKILEQKSQYMQIIYCSSAPNSQVQPTSAYTPGAGTDTLDGVFCTSATLVPTMFLSLNPTVDAYNSSVAFVGENNETSRTGDTLYGNAASRFAIKVKGTESIKVFNSFHTIDCNAGVAGAYSNVARQTHLNQIASAQAYGAYSGTLTSNYTFQDALTNMNSGIVTVFNSNGSPQIFGTRNSFNVGHEGSYFARCNVSRVLASVLKNVIAQCVDVIHTDTAANAVSRKMFETNLNNIIGQYISTQDLQADSIAICNASNNSDAQTQGGTILNIILALHFIGLVEKINIRVIATETGVTVNFA